MNNLKFRKFFSGLTAVIMSLVLLFGITVASVPRSAAAGKNPEIYLNPDYYKNETGNVEYKPETDNLEVSDSKYSVSIPMTDIIKPFENEVKLAAGRGLYPHGRDGKNRIAYVRYSVVFPEGSVVDGKSIKMTNTTSMFQKNGMSYEIKGNTVNFKFKLNDVNWQGIYDSYNNDLKDPSAHTIDVTIPYSYSEKMESKESFEDLKNLEITGYGDFAFYPSGTAAAWGFGLKEFKTNEVKIPMIDPSAKVNVGDKTLTQDETADTYFTEEDVLEYEIIKKGSEVDLSKMEDVKEGTEIEYQLSKNNELLLRADLDFDDFSKNGELSIVNGDKVKKLVLNSDYKIQKGSTIFTIFPEVFQDIDGKTVVVAKTKGSDNVNRTAKAYLNVENTMLVARDVDEVLGSTTGTVKIFDGFGFMNEEEASKLEKYLEDNKDKVLVNGYGDRLSIVKLDYKEVTENNGDSLNVLSEKEGRLYEYPLNEKAIKEKYQEGVASENFKPISSEYEYALLPTVEVRYYHNAADERGNFMDYIRDHYNGDKEGEREFIKNLDERFVTYNGGTLKETQSAGKTVNNLERLKDLYPYQSGFEIVDNWVDKEDDNKSLDTGKRIYLYSSEKDSEKENSFKSEGSVITLSPEKIITKLKGDLRVLTGDGKYNTEDKSVYKVQNNKDYVIQATLNVEPIHYQINKICEVYNSFAAESGSPLNLDQINLFTDGDNPGIQSTLKAEFELPAGVELALPLDPTGTKLAVDDWNFNNGNEKEYSLFKVDTKAVTVSKDPATGVTKVTVPMVLNNYNQYGEDGKLKTKYTFLDLLNAVNENSPHASEDGYVLDIPVKVNTDNFDYMTIKGTIGGGFYSSALKLMDFDFAWQGVQKADGLDFIIAESNPTAAERNRVWFTMQREKEQFKSLNVVKKWVDGNGNEIQAPVDDVEVILTKENSLLFRQNLTLKREDNFKGTFDKLKGNLKDYRIREKGEKDGFIKVGGKTYSVEYIFDEQAGTYEIINILSEEKVPSDKDKDKEKEKEKDNKKEETVKEDKGKTAGKKEETKKTNPVSTGDANRILPLAVLGAASAMILVTDSKRRSGK